MEFFKKTNFDFLGNRKIAYIISISLIVVGLLAIILRGFNFGIDFVGGTLIQMKMEPTPQIDEVRKVLDDNQIKSAQIQQYKQSNEIVVRVREQDIVPIVSTSASVETSTSSETLAGASLTSSTEKKFYDMFLNAFPNTKIEITKVEMVGPAVGKKTLRQAIWALVWGMLGIMVYVGWRFEFKYSAPAVLSLAHDVFIVTSLFALFNKEIDMTTIAALLTVAGYSINDTIVIYDRIREKIKFFAKEDLGKVMNLAINETLGRTVITGVSTIIVLLSLFFFGGEVIHNFSFAILIGTILGTYSSVFVASPLVYEWEMHHRK